MISGPNMGGKTVALKMAGLFVVMTYCGMQLPAGGGTCIGRFERVVADIGDEQSLVANASTFSAHLERMREILEGAERADAGDRRRDRRRHGAERRRGARRRDARTIARRAARGRSSRRTRLELKLFAHATPGVANASVRFDPEDVRADVRARRRHAGAVAGLSARRAIGHRSADRRARGALLERRERDYEAALAELALRNGELREDATRWRASAATSRASSTACCAIAASSTPERRRFAARAPKSGCSRALRDFVRELQRRASQLGSDRGRENRR